MTNYNTWTEALTAQAEDIKKRAAKPYDGEMLSLEGPLPQEVTSLYISVSKFGTRHIHIFGDNWNFSVCPDDNLLPAFAPDYVKEIAAIMKEATND